MWLQHSVCAAGRGFWFSLPLPCLITTTPVSYYPINLHMIKDRFTPRDAAKEFGVRSNNLVAL